MAASQEPAGGRQHWWNKTFTAWQPHVTPETVKRYCQARQAANKESAMAKTRYDDHALSIKSGKQSGNS